MKKSRFWILFSAILLTGLPLGWAGLTNQGNDAVQIEFQKKNDLSQSATLFPGQSMETPEGTVSVRVVSRGMGGRGDESIRLKVVERTGKEGLLTEYGQSYTLGITEEEEAPVVLKEGRMVNNGNIAVDVAMRQKNGRTRKTILYLNQSLTLPRNIYEVEVLQQGRLRGDEIVRVDVLMPDGTAVSITSLGGIARALPENAGAYDRL